MVKSKYSNLHYDDHAGYSWEKYVEHVNLLFNSEDFWIFRGHSNQEWELSTSIQRSDVRPENRLAFEEQLIDQLKRRIDLYLSNELCPTNIIEWLSLLQHYGASTRLLDWTKSPFIASFFAFTECLHHDPCVWALNASKLVQIIANKYPDIFLNVFEQNIKKQRLLFEGITINVNLEDERLLMEFSKNNLDMVFPVYPYKLNQRINNQQGLFIAQGNIENKFEDCIANIDPDHKECLIQKIIIHKSEKYKVLRNLHNMNINYATLFPGIEGVTKSININCIQNFI